MADPTLQEVHSALSELRTSFDAIDSKNEKNFSELDALTKGKVDKINEFLDLQEVKNQDLVKQQAIDVKANEELNERFDALEKSVAHSSTVDKKDYKETEEYKALAFYFKHGDTKLTAEHKALLRTDIDSQGGYRTTEELDTMIIKKITEISPIRAVSRVRTVSAKEFRMVTRDSILQATFEGETGTSEEDTSTYGSIIMNTYRQTVTVPLTIDQSMNDAFNIEADIFADANESFAQGEGQEFILGVNPTGPKGIIVNASIGGLDSGTTGKVDADDYILIQGELKVGYNPMYAFNRRTLADLRTKQSTSGGYLFLPGLNGPAANTVAGAPYILAEDMPDIAAGNKAVLYGDFMRGYTIIDRTGLSSIRDDFTRKKDAIIEYTIHRWLNGAVTLPEAFKIITVAS